MNSNEHYLDYNATAPLLPEVWEAMQAVQATSYGNPSSPQARDAEPGIAWKRPVGNWLPYWEWNIRNYVSPAAAVKATMRSSDNFCGRTSQIIGFSPHLNILPCWKLPSIWLNKGKPP